MGRRPAGRLPRQRSGPAGATTVQEGPAGAPDGFRGLRTLTVFGVLMAVNVLVAVMSAGTFYASHHTGGGLRDFLAMAYELVALDAEHGVATWVSSVLWVLLGAVAAIYCLMARSLPVSWGFFALVGLMASLDEYAELHERLRAIGERMQPHVPFQVSYAWVLPGAVLVVVVVAVLLRLVLSLPRRVAVLLVVSGLVFLTGAVVLEVLAGALKDGHGGTAGRLFWTFSQAEELLELTGVSLALSALLSLVELDRRRRVLRILV